MPRKALVRSTEYPYHITARCNNNDWYKLALPKVWNIYCKNIKLLNEKYSFKPLAFVLMSNHFHMLIQTPLANIDKGMMWFMRHTSLAIGKQSGRVNKIYGSRYKPCLITSPEYYKAAYKYIYRNPIKAKICNKVEDYQWSSLNSNEIKLYDYEDFYFSENKNKLLKWLNEPSSKELEESTRKALKKTTFKLARNKRNKRKATTLNI